MIKKLIFMLFLLSAPMFAAGPTYVSYTNWCYQGGLPTMVQGMKSSTLTQTSFPTCQVTVYVHGDGLATLYSDKAGTPLSNPFTATSNGQFEFYVDTTLATEYDVTMTGGTPAPGFPSPVTYADVFIGGGGGGGGGGPGACEIQGANIGDICYFNGTNWIILSGNPSSLKFLGETSGTPSWQTGGVLACSGASAGDICYFNGASWLIVTGNSGATKFLSETSGLPSWQTVTSGVSSIQPQNNGVNYGSAQTGAITMNFANCTVSATFTITCPSGSPAGSSGDLQMNNGSGGLAASHLNDNGTTITGSEPVDLGSNYENAEYYSHPETAGAGGVSANTLVTFDTSNPSLVITAPTNATGVLGITATAGLANAGVRVVVSGDVNCIADNNVTAGHLMGVGSTTAGRCKDLGVTTSQGVTSVTQIVGKAEASGTTGNPVLVHTYGAGHYGTLVVAASTNTSVCSDNGCKQPVSTRTCADTSGSGTVQVCNTSPTFVPAAGDYIIYTTTTSNTGDVTVNVNSLGAVHIRKNLGASVLVSADLPANVNTPLYYDGTYWEILTIANTPSGSTAFSAITSATNTTAAMTVGTGASLATSGTGTIAATKVTTARYVGTFPAIATAQTWATMAPYAATFPANFTTPTSTVKCGTNPGGTVVFTFTDVTTSTTLGTVSVSSSCVGTFATTGGTSKSVSEDDYLTVVSGTDATAVNVVIDWKATQ